MTKTELSIYLIIHGKLWRLCVMSFFALVMNKRVFTVSNQIREVNVMNDTQLVDKVLNGDTGAFELLILKYQNQVFYAANNIVKNKEFAEDISQDAFLRAYEKLDTLQNKEQFFPWLKRIAINLARNHYVRGKRIVDIESEESDDNYFENRIAGGDSPEDYIIKDELKKYVRMFVDALPERLRTVVILREVEDMSYEEIADILNIPLGTVRSRLFNARQIIKDRLIKQGLTDQVVSEAK